MDLAVHGPTVLDGAPEQRAPARFVAAFAVAGVLLALTLGAFGCAGERQDVLSAHDAHEGEVRVFDVGMNQAWEAARAALRWNHAGTIEEHRAEGYLLATAGVSAWSWGAAMGVWLESANAQGTQVRAIVSRRLATNIAAQSEGMLLDDIAKAVALEKQGQPLRTAIPTKAPPSEDSFDSTRRSSVSGFCVPHGLQLHRGTLVGVAYFLIVPRLLHLKVLHRRNESPEQPTCAGMNNRGRG